MTAPLKHYYEYVQHNSTAPLKWHNCSPCCDITISEVSTGI